METERGGGPHGRDSGATWSPHPLSRSLGRWQRCPRSLLTLTSPSRPLCCRPRAAVMVTGTHCPQLQSPGAPDPGVSRLGSSAGCEGGPSHASAWFLGFPGALGHHRVSTFMFTWLSSHVQLCAQVSPFHKDTGHIGLGVHPTVMTSS